jgi:pimeloyl-ACP methyl ester carboxylesterase
MEQRIKRRGWLKKLGFAVLGLVGLGALLLVVWYQIDGQPLPEARAFLQGQGYESRELDDGGLLFTPREKSARGIVLLHGALIEPLAYARTGAFFAQKGYTVLVPRGAGRLSIRAIDGAGAKMNDLGVTEWFLLGHSMGGMASLLLWEKRPAGIRAVALWASAIPGDFTKVSVPVLFVWGDHDGLIPGDRFSELKARLPSGTQFVTAEGGNHRGFALYSHQFFDAQATVEPASQIDFANEQTASFFGRF